MQSQYRIFGKVTAIWLEARVQRKLKICLEFLTNTLL
jgi:hypothetical protein